MSKQVQDAYICAATRLPIGKSGRGYFKNTRPDEMLSLVVQAAMAQKMTRGMTPGHHLLLHLKSPCIRVPAGSETERKQTLAGLSN